MCCGRAAFLLGIKRNLTRRVPPFIELRCPGREDAVPGWAGRQRQPIWNFVETGHPFSDSQNGARSIAPAEVRSAVWHSLIAGARGIIYFQHSFGGPCSGDNHTIRTNCEGTRPIVTSVNAQIKSIAPALNGPRVSPVLR